jgi:hypothetical protein
MPDLQAPEGKRMVKATKKKKKKLWVSARAWELLNSKMTGGFQTRTLASVKSRLGEEISVFPRPLTLPSFFLEKRRSREIFRGD